jgi:hypothetical protein
MNTQEEFNDKLVKKYLNPGTREQAPAGFTENIMQRVILETRPAPQKKSIFRQGLVPSVYIIFTIALMAVAALLPTSFMGTDGSHQLLILKQVSTFIRALSPDSINTIPLPAWLPYAFIAILFLTLFDLGLKGLFQKGE